MGGNWFMKSGNWRVKIVEDWIWVWNKLFYIMLSVFNWVCRVVCVVVCVVRVLFVVIYIEV